MKLDEACVWLGLPPRGTFTIEAVKKAYKKAAIKHHPDKNIGDEGATERFQNVGQAYKVIITHVKRNAASSGGAAAECSDDESADEEEDERYSYESLFRQHFSQADFEEAFQEIIDQVEVPPSLCALWGTVSQLCFALTRTGADLGPSRIPETQAHLQVA